MRGRRGSRCCCGPCACIGCATLTISGAEAPNTTGLADCNAVVQETYNRQVVLWGRQASDVTPWDLFAELTVGQSEEAATYPGTSCRMFADLCCQASADDTLPDPDEPDIAPPPPPPPPPP